MVGTVGFRLRGVLWLLPTLAFGLLTWLSFLYLGLRTRHRPFLIWAGVYFVAIVVAVVADPDSDTGSALWSALSTILLLLVFLGGFVHALVVHRRYSAWRRQRRYGSSAYAARPTQPWPAAHGQPSYGQPSHGQPWYGAPPSQGGFGQQPYGGPPPVQPWPGQEPAQGGGVPQLGMPDLQPWFADLPPPPPPPPTRPVQPLDLGTATVDELAAVPAVGPVLARRLVAERTARGGLTSVEELLDLGFAPHVVASLRRHCRVDPDGRPAPGASPPPPPRGRGRVLDV